MSNILKKTSHAIEALERSIIMLAVLAMIVNSTANAIGRYFFNQSIFFAES